jgi:hypothetical protein
MSVEIDVEITGLDAFMRMAEGIADKMELASYNNAGEALVRLGHKIVDLVKEHYVPVDVGQQGTHSVGYAPLMIRITRQLKAGARRVEGGTLRNSVGSSVIAEFVEGGVEVHIWAGKPGSGAEKYAAVQHENLMYRHQVGQAKYIEVPVLLICPVEMAPEIAKSVKTGFDNAWG